MLNKTMIYSSKTYKTMTCNLKVKRDFLCSWHCEVYDWGEFQFHDFESFKITNLII